MKDISAIVTDSLGMKIFGTLPTVFLEAWTGNLHTLSPLVLRCESLRSHRLAHLFPEFCDVLSPVDFRGEFKMLFLECELHGSNFSASLYGFPGEGQRGVLRDVFMGFF